MSTAGYIWTGILVILVVAVLANWKRLSPAGPALKHFYREVSFEMTKVAWPTQPEVINSTKMVLLLIVVLTVVFGIVDAILANLVGLLYR